DLVPLHFGAMVFGGGQENGVRSGTQAVANIAGFGAAAALAAQEMPAETLRLIHLRGRFFSLMADTPELIPTGHPRQRLPHHVSFCLADSHRLRHLTGKALVRQMNLAGIGISAGSACHSGKLSPSPVLQAIGLSDRTAQTGIRLTLGKDTTEADVDWSAMVLKQILARTLSEQTALTA
ncbi:MAG: aminotransferase class V-fold PLP-dependent enzyme, partial [Cyanobacteria bacterium J06649_4]